MRGEQQSGGELCHAKPPRVVSPTVPSGAAREPAGCGERPSGQPIKSRPMSDPPEDERLERAGRDARPPAAEPATPESPALQHGLARRPEHSARAPPE